jgi:type IV pilus assembly protein PilM
VFAIQNAYELNYDVDRSKIIALVNMGAAVTNINVLARGQTLFWRDISFGGNQFTEALQREFNLSFENAEALKRGREVEGHTASDARRVLEAVGGEMSGEIQKTFDFFSTDRQRGIGRPGRALRAAARSPAGLRDVLGRAARLLDRADEPAAPDPVPRERLQPGVDRVDRPDDGGSRSGWRCAA